MTEHLPLFERGRYTATLYTRCSQYGTPYAVGLVTSDSGDRHTVLIDSREFNLDHCEHLEGLDVRLTPTEKGLRLKPLAQQPESFTELLVARLEKGPNPERPQTPELVEDSNPPAHPAADEPHPAVPVIGELIAYTAKVAVERNLPMAGWAFVPVNTTGGSDVAC